MSATPNRFLIALMLICGLCAGYNSPEGVFSSRECRLFLAGKADLWGQVFDVYMAEQGEPLEATELANRAIRYAYLVDRAIKAKAEYDAAVYMNELFVDWGLIGSGESGPGHDLSATVAALKYGDREIPENYPHLYALINVRPPSTEAQARDLEDLLETRYYLAQARAEFSKLFVDHYAPENQVLSSDPEILEEAHAQANHVLLKIMDPSLADILSDELNGTTPVTDKDRRRAEQMRRRLLGRNRMPSLLQADLVWEKVFERKYNLPLHPLNRLLIEQYARYLGGLSG